MSKRNRREHGRILSVETKNRGDSLADDFAAGVTSITVNDAGDFDEDGGWLYVGAQTVEYLDCDDDTGVITLADPLTAAAEQGDPVSLWSDLYGEVVDYQLALVELDGEYDNPDPVAAEVAEGVGELPEGDRGKAGESCTLIRVADDEWEVVGVGGRPAAARPVKFHQDQTTVTDVSDEQQIALTFEPIENSEHVYWNGVYQPGSEWTREDRTVRLPDAGRLVRVNDLLVVEYAYRKGISTPLVASTPAALVLADAVRSSPGAALAYDSSADVYNDAVQLGDLMLKVGVTTYGGTPSTGADWTLLDSFENPATSSNNGIRAMLWCKYADQGTLDAPQKLTSVGSSSSTAGALVILRGSTVGAVTAVKSQMAASPAEGGTANVPAATVSTDGSAIVTFGATATDASVPDISVPDGVVAGWGFYVGAAAGLITDAPAGTEPGGALATIQEESAYYAMWRVVCPPGS